MICVTGGTAEKEKKQNQICGQIRRFASVEPLKEEKKQNRICGRIRRFASVGPLKEEKKQNRICGRIRRFASVEPLKKRETKIQEREANEERQFAESETGRERNLKDR